MKPKNMSLIAVAFMAGLTLTMFQNCSKVSAVDSQSTVSNKVGNNVATATDDDGREVPVTVAPADEVIPDADQPQQPTSQPPVSQEDRPKKDDDKSPVEPVSDEMKAACGLDLKTIHNVVDLAQFKGQDVNLELLKGKTLIMSSDPQLTLKSLSIDAAVGRTILCGCKVDKLNMKKGRLEVYQSEIKEIGSQSGKLIKDASSLLPAGF